jgi:hypothetical protein
MGVRGLAEVKHRRSSFGDWHRCNDVRASIRLSGCSGTPEVVAIAGTTTSAADHADAAVRKHILGGYM